MAISETTRRELLRRMSALSCCGAAASTFGLQLATMGEAAAQTAPAFQALVCIFLFGGNDANNMVLPTDADSWGRYFALRNTGTEPIALMPAGTPATAVGAVNPVTGRTPTNFSIPEAWGGVLPITSTRCSSPGGMVMVSPSSCTSSWGTTVSSPAGMTAPVMIFTHCPAARAPA